GSLLLWVLLLSLFSSVVLRVTRNEQREVVPYATAVLGTIASFFLVLTVFYAIPFAFAVGSLITRRTGMDWIRSTRRFALIAWTFLGFGIMLGALWSFSELGWGGYWGWDAV